MTDGHQKLLELRTKLASAKAELERRYRHVEEQSSLLKQGAFNHLSLEEQAQIEAELLADAHGVQDLGEEIRVLQEVTIPELEREQPEWPQYAAAWLSYADLRQAHVDQIVPHEEPDEHIDFGEQGEVAMSRSLGFPFLLEFIEWAKTVRHPSGLDLTTWPHTLPYPPDEPPQVWEQLEARLESEDARERAFCHLALNVLAEARAVRDYQSQRARN